MPSPLTYLYSLQKFGMKFGLRNTKILMRSLGNPHKVFKSIHIAGTNGKGSTSSMIAAIFSAAGYKVGLYSSPHLVRFNERIRINGKMISNTDLAKYTKKVQPIVDRNKATFFEATTAIAFKYFADKNVDIAIIETGLGGRLDSTNIVIPIVSVITTIGKDHTEQLGNTISAIAKEKAGIIKYKIPIVVGDITKTALTIVRQKAKEKKSKVVLAQNISMPSQIDLELIGRHQIANAKNAITAVSLASKYFFVDDVTLKKGLEHTSKYTGLRARCELIKNAPDMLLDVAHNPDGINSLIGQLRKIYYKKIVIVFGVMKDKDYYTMLKHLKALHAVIVLTKPVIERALPVEALYSITTKMKFPSYCAPEILSAITLSKKLAGNKGLIVVTGSHYLVGDVIKKLKI